MSLPVIIALTSIVGSILYVLYSDYESLKNI